MRRRACLKLHALSLLSPLATMAVHAQPQGGEAVWPEREPLRLVVPFPVGGTSDRIGRRVADLLGREIGQRILVDNIGGARFTRIETAGHSPMIETPAEFLRAATEFLR